MSFIFAGIIYSAAFVAPTRSADAPRPAAARVSAPAGREAVAKPAAENLSRALPASALPFAPVFQAGEESVATYAADCATPRTEFNLGETVCVQVLNAPAPFRPTRPLRGIAWVGPANVKRQQASITTNPQTNSFTLPSTLTSSVAGATVDNRGEWLVVLTGTSDGSAIAKAVFNVKDPNNKAANLSVYQAPIDGEVNANGNAGFRVLIANRGPDDATNVQLTDAIPQNTTFVSETQNSGPPFTCTDPADGASSGTSTCTIASLPAGSKAVFTFIYKVGSTVPVKTLITNTAAITGTTTDPRPTDNSSTAQAVVTAVTADTDCVLACPSDIVVAANTTHDPDGEGPAAPISGANVTFDAAEPFGSCGTITSSHPSGSFFPVGTTSVTSTSSTGGGSCSFNVTVTAGGGPTISCPANIVTSTSGCTATVANLGTPTTTGSGVTVEGTRSDDDALDAPYPVGVTTITWRATDDLGRTTTCTQTVTVNSSGTDAAPPTITAPPDATYSTGTEGGSCGLIVGESLLGEATATDDGCAVTISRTGVPAGNFFPVGQTTVTWKATDASGKTATATQVVTVVENTPPVINAPADATYACLSDVPAASASQATGAGTFDGNGNHIPGPPSDNCGVPTVTITESVTGGTPGNPRVITRTFTATDAAGNTASDDQVISISDATPPVVTPPANVVTSAPADSCAASVDPGTASVTDNCADATVVGTRSDNQPLNAPYPGGVTTITWTGTDANGNQATASQTVTVNDVTAPVINLKGANPFTVECQTAFNDPGATAADACDADITVNASGVVDVTTPGTYTITYTATDDSGNPGTATRTVNVVDTTPPVMDCPDDIVVYLPLNSTATSMNVTYPAATATDSCGGALPVTYSKASGSVFDVGPTVVTATATDAHGNKASCTFTVTVRYNFTGFFSPVANPTTFNEVKGGQSVPIKFSLSGNKGSNILAANSPVTTGVACPGTPPYNEISEVYTLTAGNSGLSYDSLADQYKYVWKTESEWAGTCRALVVKLNDGSSHTALFKFK